MTNPVLEEFITVLENQGQLSIEKFMGIILAKARRLTDAEAGSIFLSHPVGAPVPEELYGCSVQNDVARVKAGTFIIPADPESIAGYVATHGETLEIEDLYNLDPSLPYHFNKSFDDASGYHSTSMLAFPLKNFDGFTVGVVQLINHVDQKGKYSPFPLKAVDDMHSVMNILGVIVERTELRNEVERLRKELKDLKKDAA